MRLGTESGNAALNLGVKLTNVVSTWNLDVCTPLNTQKKFTRMTRNTFPKLLVAPISPTKVGYELWDVDET